MPHHNHVRFPINIATAQGAYHLELFIGSEQIPVKLLIDTGSSTMAFHANVYSVEQDQHACTSQFAQCVTYGMGGWAGPVLHSTVTYNNGIDSFTIDKAAFAIIEDETGKNFLNLDGILGMAYHHLNKSHDLTNYYESNHDNEIQTYPWSFSDQIKQTSISAFKSYLNQFPEQDITPNFTAFADENVSMNQFALLTHRAIVYVPNMDMSLQQKQNEPLNQGLFIIGKAEAEQDLYQGSPQTVKVVHDAYYNTNLLSVQVAGFDAIKAPPLDEKHVHNFFSNSIIDSGSSYLMLQQHIYQYIIESFKSINPEFVDLIESFKKTQKQQKPFTPQHLNLKQWPDLFFTFEGLDDNEETLCCRPNHYWQLDALTPGQVFFTLLEQIPKWPDQSVLGLPLISSYFCIFDRSASSEGVIKFAQKV